MNPMTTDLERLWISARASVVGDISLFLAGQGEERTQTFLQFWNGLLERDIRMEPPTSKSEFIWRLIESTMARVRQIETTGIARRS
jgi:N-glycosylase/DNA lyase